MARIVVGSFGDTLVLDPDPTLPIVVLTPPTVLAHLRRPDGSVVSVTVTLNATTRRLTYVIARGHIVSAGPHSLTVTFEYTSRTTQAATLNFSVWPAGSGGSYVSASKE